MFNNLFFWRLESSFENYFNNVGELNNYQNFFTNYDYDFFKYKKDYKKDYLKISQNIKFSDGCNDFLGLEGDLLFNIQNKPFYVVDNHNKVLPAFFEIFSFTKKKLNLVHIDAHRDDAIFHGKLPNLLNYDAIKKLTKKCGIADYIDCAEQINLISNVVSLTESYDFLNFNLPSGDFFLNLDIDIYGEEGSAVCKALKTKVIADCIKKSKAVFIATSPGFICQHSAFNICDIIINCYLKSFNSKY